MCSLDFRGGPSLQLPAGTNLTIICDDDSSNNSKINSSSSGRQTVSIYGSREPVYIPEGSTLRIIGCNVQTAPVWAAEPDAPSSQELDWAFFGGSSQGDVHLAASTLLCPLQVSTCLVQ